MNKELTWAERWPTLAQAFRESEGFTVGVHLISGKYVEIAAIMPTSASDHILSGGRLVGEERLPIDIQMDAIEALEIIE